MAVRVHKPTTPGRRNSSVADFSDLTKKRPERSLIVAKKRKAGRNNQGKITVRHRGGGAKRYYRVVDFSRTDHIDVLATVVSLEYDPNRSAHIALIEYAESKDKAYILAPAGLKVGDTVVTSRERAEIAVGNRMPLRHIPSGMMVHAVELYPGLKGLTVRAAGVGAKVMSVEDEWTILKLPSGELRKFSSDCLATIGQVGNTDHRHIRWGKAGRRRHLGFRPTVRGKAMNPVDHPHGGGEGSNPIGMKHPKTPQGKPALGVKTRKKKFSDAYILRRRSAKKRRR